jgi:phospholipase D1/2
MLPLELGLGGRMDATAGQKALEDERTTFDRQGHKEHGFASSTVPTLEERVVSENKSTAELKDASSDNGGKTSTGQLYGSPADANQNDTGPSGRAGRALSPEEQKAPLARSALRNDLTSGFDPGSAWSLPTPTPEVDPDMFEDPLCDAFWKDIWLAAAVHNVKLRFCLEFSPVTDPQHTD